MPPFPFDPPPGINANDSTFSAAGQWVDGDNVRFFQGKPQAVGGNTSAFFTLGGTSDNPCRDLFVLMRSGSPVIAYGQGGGNATAGILAIGDGSGTSLAAPTARTPASLSTNADEGWCFAAWGEILLAAGRGTTTAQGGRLYEQTGSSTATHVTQAPARNTCILVTNERQVLSFGCNEEVSGTFNAMCIRGSDLEDYTDWTTTATNNAFEHILDGGGAIITAHKVGAYVAVWTSIGLWLGQYIGDPAQTYRFDKVADGMAPISVRSVGIHDGVAYWIDKSLHLRAWAPGQPVQTIPCPMLNPDDASPNVLPFESTTFLVVNTLFGELWHFSPGLGSYIAYSVGESELAGRPVWFKGTNTYRVVIFSDLLLIQGPAANTSRQVLAIEQEGSCVASNYITSGDFSLNNGGSRAMIRGMVPDIKKLSSNTAAFNLTITTRDYPQSTTTYTSGPHAITTATTKQDFRASGKLAAIKLQSTDTDGWRLGKPVFDIVPLGER